MKRLLTTAAAVACMIQSLSALAADGDPEAGRRKTVTCNGCHGQASMLSVPKLGGQRVAYFVAAMQAYQEGKRTHATMRDVAKGYTDKEIKNFAAYYAQFLTAVDADSSTSERPANVALCESCHGPDGRAPVNPESAILAGQKATYLKAVLRDYREGPRAHEAMRSAVGNLTDAELDALADYFAGLPGLVVK